MWEHQGADQCLLQEIIKVILFLKRQYYNVRVIFISQCKLCGTTKYRKGRHLNIRKCNNYDLMVSMSNGGQVLARVFVLCSWTVV